MFSSLCRTDHEVIAQSAVIPDKSKPPDMDNQRRESKDESHAADVTAPKGGPSLVAITTAPAPAVNQTLVDEREQQDTAFVECETEYQEIMSTLQSDESLSKFRAEYEKMHKAVLRSRHHAMVLYKQHEELHNEYVTNQIIGQEALRNSMQDQLTLKTLKDQIQKAEEMIEASNKREDTAKEELRQLKQDVNNLLNTVKQGVGLSAAQERTLNELISTKENYTKELESELESIVHLRNAISDITDKIRSTDQLKRDREHEIYDLKERNATKKADIDAEIRNKERLERDLRELRVIVAVKSQEVRSKQEAVNRATDDISILESQIKSQRQMLEKLAKDQETLEARAIKLQQDCNEQITLTGRLMEQNEELGRDLKIKEAELSHNKMEIKRINKLRDVLGKKNRQLEEEKGEAEHERRSLRAENDSKSYEIDRMKRAVDLTKKEIDDLMRERDILNLNSLKTTNETSRHMNASLLLRQARHNLELELTRDNREVADQLKEIKQLETERENYINQAATLQAQCLKGLQDVKDKEMEIFEYKKKMIQADTKLKHQQNLYEAVQSDRNLHSKHLIESQAEITEMKRKLKIMNFQINGFKEDINSKEDSLNKEINENAKLEKDIEIISEEVKTLRNQNELAQAYIKSQLMEETKLNQFVKEADLERSRQENALHILISERDNLSAQLIRQNGELSKAYNQIKTQQSSLIRSERYYADKLKAVHDVVTDILALKQENLGLHDDLAELEPLEELTHKLRSEITRERTKIKALEDELKNPVNVHRWRKLEGSNPKAFEMIQLLHSLQTNLIAKAKEDRDKEEMIGSQEKLYLHLKGILAKQIGPEALEQVDEYQQILKNKTMQLKHMGIELNMYQAQVREYKHAVESLQRSLDGVKMAFIDMRKGRTKPQLFFEAPKTVVLPPLPSKPVGVMLANDVADENGDGQNEDMGHVNAHFEVDENVNVETREDEEGQKIETLILG
ncbi:hypothetical protein HDU76_006576 [Blyttiomyces sp. JEL0837]|nr:hypothetical protein HDU76_006576 [Blyttiomyces sp. JEL0837]